MDREKILEACGLMIDIEARPLLRRSFPKFSKKKEEIIQAYTQRFHIPAEEFHRYESMKLYQQMNPQSIAFDLTKV